MATPEPRFSWRFLSEPLCILEVHHVLENGTLARSEVTWSSDQFDFDCPLVYAFDGGTLSELDAAELAEDLARYHRCERTLWWADGLAGKARAA